MTSIGQITRHFLECPETEIGTLDGEVDKVGLKIQEIETFKLHHVFMVWI